MYDYVMIKDGAKARTYEVSYNGGRKKQTTSKKFPCIGGPFDKQYLTRIDLQIAGLWNDYCTYNRAGWTQVPNQVFIHRSVFPCL